MAYIFNTYDSIVPDQMSNRDIRNLCGELQVAKQQGRKHAVVRLRDGGQIRYIPVSELSTYQKYHKTQTN